MEKFWASLFFISSIVLLQFCQNLYCQTAQKSPIIFESDSLEYREGEQVILASGNVTVFQTSYTFQSNRASIDIPNKKVKAWGNVIFKDINKNEIRADLLNYNQSDGSAKLEVAQGSFGPWLFSTKKIERDSEGGFILERAKLSSCETDLSKYHLYGYRIRVMPKKRLTVQHALFRVGPIPVLYLPYYYYPLGEKHLAFQIFPGKSDSEGGFVRTVWGYPPTDELYVKLYLDYLSLRGTGTGGEFNYYADKIKGSLYTYRIDDQKNHQNRWNARLAHWQSLTPSWTMQANANQMSDDSFPNDFFREDFNRVVRDLSSSLAFTYQKRSATFRILTERKEIFNLNENKFIAEDASLPRIDFNQAQTPLGILGIDKTISINFTNRFAGKSSTGTLLTRDIRQESQAQFNLIKSFTLSQGFQLIPKVFIRNHWISQPQNDEFKVYNVQRAGTETTLRQKLFLWGTIDWTYRYTQRLQENLGDDQGRDEHEVTFFSWIRPNDSVSLRLDSGYLLPRIKGENLAFSNLDKYKPIRAELSLDPNSHLQIFFREEYILSDPNTGSSHPLTSQSEIIWGKKALGEDYLALQTSYFNSQDHQFEIRPSLRYSPSKKWKLEGSIRTALFYKNQNILYVSKADLVEKEIQSKFEWRCWKFAVLFRERKGVFEFLFNLELELDEKERKSQQKPNREAEFYPWRKAT